MREARFRTLSTLLALVSLLLLADGQAARTKERPWIELQSRNFLVVSNEAQEGPTRAAAMTSDDPRVHLALADHLAWLSDPAHDGVAPDEVMQWSHRDDEIEAARELLASLDAPGPAEPAASAKAALSR